MSAETLALVPGLGPWLLAALVALASLGVPLPATLALLMSGALAGSGEIGLLPVVAAGYLGAVAGDNLGYMLGRMSSARALRLIGRGPGGAARRAAAEAAIAKHGAWAVFLSRWLVAPIGPAVNIATGAGGMAWARFAAAGMAGEVIWVTIYAGLGYAFSGSIAATVNLFEDVALLILAGGATVFLGLRLRRALDRPREG